MSAQTSRALVDLVRHPDRYLDERVLTKARIEFVCQTAGCWCLLQDGGEQLYVSMTTFALPPDTAGSLCRVQGRLIMRDERLTLLATGIELLDE